MKKTWNLDPETALYIPEFELIRFIEINSGMGWNTACDYVKKFLNEEGKTLFSNSEMKASDEVFVEAHGVEALWVKKFFETHSINQDVMFVFDD